MVLINESILYNQWNSGNKIPMILFLILFLYSLFTFESLRTSNPGFISKNEIIFENLNSNDFQDIPSIESYRKSKKTEEKLTSTIKIPMRSKYCKRCENYVSKFDHHCFWIGRCKKKKKNF